MKEKHNQDVFQLHTTATILAENLLSTATVSVTLDERASFETLIEKHHISLETCLYYKMAGCHTL